MTVKSFIKSFLHKFLLWGLLKSSHWFHARLGSDYQDFLLKHLLGLNKQSTFSKCTTTSEIQVLDKFLDVFFDKHNATTGQEIRALAGSVSQLVLNKTALRIGSNFTICGHDNELNRKEWVRRSLGAIAKGSRILDAGAGEQQYKKFCTHLEYVSQDFAQYDGTGDTSGLQTGGWRYGNIDIISDISKIPEPDASFDAILCTEVFEHISNPIEAIKEFSRLLKPKGTLIITAPFSSLTHFAPHYYYTGFSRYFYEKILIENGFCDITISNNGGYFDYMAQELNRLPSIINRYSSECISPDLISNLNLLQDDLTKYIHSDGGSNELLCYGLHVTAHRI